MSHWETAERHNFAKKAIELLKLRKTCNAKESDLDCTIVLAALTMLLCNSRDSFADAKKGLMESHGAPSIPMQLVELYSKRIDEVPGLKCVANTMLQSEWRTSVCPPCPNDFENSVVKISFNPQVGTLISDMRNALAHGSIAWTKDGEHSINGALLVNARSGENPEGKPQKWRARYFDLNGLIEITRWWANALQHGEHSPSTHNMTIAQVSNCAMEAA